MSFCTNCGAEILRESDKFCHKCGCPLNKTDDTAAFDTLITESEEDQETDLVEETFKAEIKGTKAYQLGEKLEKAVERILKAKGYTTERRKRISSDNVSSEIDIVARRNRKGILDEIIVECKNYSSPVPVKEVQAFIAKMNTLGKKKGLFAVIPGFSSEASQWGQNAGLQLWNWENINEKLNEIEVGRLGLRELGRIKYFLPLKYTYQEAVNLKFENEANVDISSANLIWKPYFVFNYKYNSTRINPRKRKLTFNDDGEFVFDGISGYLLEPSEGFKNTLKKIIGQTKDEQIKTKEDDIAYQDLYNAPETGLRLTEVDDYEISILKPVEKEERLRKQVIDMVIEGNTVMTYYKLKRDEDNLLADEKGFKVTPLVKEIKVNWKCVYVPKWEIEYQSKEYQYIRILSGYSGSTIYDTVTYCNRHLDIRLTRKQNIAACDICGKAQCKDHIWKCTHCGTWRCEEHISTCVDCGKKYCPEHITIKCSVYTQDLCDSCASTCEICGETICKKHSVICSKCGKLTCTNCSVKEGGVLGIGQKTICSICKT